MIVGITSGEFQQDKPAPLTQAQEFAWSGGLKGGAARAKTLAPERRQEIAREATEKRWGKK